MKAHGVGRAGADGLFSGGQLWELRPGEARRARVPRCGGRVCPDVVAAVGDRTRSHARAGAASACSLSQCLCLLQQTKASHRVHVFLKSPMSLLEISNIYIIVGSGM